MKDVMDVVEKYGGMAETAVWCRDYLIERGFSESAAEAITVHRNALLVRALGERTGRAQRLTDASVGVLHAVRRRLDRPGGTLGT